MRVVAGSARGVTLTTPAGDHTRPTTDRVKEAMFSAIQFIIPGASVLDLFAGSGQLGIEALSRGAAKARFVDENQAAIDAIKANLKATGLTGIATVSKVEARYFLAGIHEKFDIVLMDPPYGHGTVAELLPILAEKLSDNGVLLCETEPEAQLPQAAGTLVQKKQYRYGHIMVTKYIKEDNAL